LCRIYTNQPDKERASHIETNCTQKVILTIGSSLLALLDPSKGNHIATLGETTGSAALKIIQRKMQQDLGGRRILSEKPYINSDTLKMKDLSLLPTNTFGYGYYQFMNDRGFEADDRTRVKFIDSEELVYVMQRYREVHDFWHVLSGLDTTVLDELGLKALEFLQTGLPMCALSSFFGPIRLTMYERYLFIKYYLPWAVKTHNSIPFLMNIYFEELLEEDLETLKRKLGFHFQIRS